MARIGPVILETVGDQYLTPARVQGIIWEGVTVAGDRAELRCPQTGALLWGGRTADTQTYLGVIIPPSGIHAPYGFRAGVLTAGRLSVYLREE